MKKILISLIILITTLSVYAQPANNACSGAITLPQNGTCLNGTTTGADDLVLGNVGCAGNNKEVWYSFTPTGTSAQIVVTNGTQGGNVEVVIVSASGACSGLTVQGSSCGASPYTATFNNLQPVLHYVLISSTGANGTFTICNTVTTPPPVPGVDCTSAAPLCNGSSFSQGTFTGIGAAENISTNTCFGGNERQSKWYTFTVDVSGTFQFLIKPNIYNSSTQVGDDFDFALWNTTTSCYTSGTTMGVSVACNWSGCSGATGVSPTFFGQTAVTHYQANNPPGPGNCLSNQQWVTTTINITAGQTYTLLIDNYSTSGGGFSASFGGTAVMGPRANFTASMSANCLTLTTNRSPHYTGSNMTYLWSFGDGSTSTAAQPTHTYAATGTYFVTLTVTDAKGCTDTYSLTVSECVVLPVELVEFNAHYNEKSKGVNIYWVTATETNNDYFTLEKSTNAINWNYLARIKGGGNMNTPSLYEYVDYKPFNGTSYYRLKQTDFNGSSETFNIISIRNEIKPNYIVSLGDNVIYLSDVYEYELYNILGQLISHGRTNMIHTSSVSSGIYIIKIGVFTEKVIIR